MRSQIKQALVASVLMFSAQTCVAETLSPPVGVRPCCAFGVDLKADIMGMSVPFWSMENTLDWKSVTEHRYNDGRNGVFSQLTGQSKERNGLILTQRGGFIDTAHVRDTADFTFYLYRMLENKLGKAEVLTLPEELRLRVIRLFEQSVPLDTQEANRLRAQLAAQLAYRLAQWHEIAQWFGYQSVMGFPEYASAFSPEDLYSNLLGATLAMHLLQEQTITTPEQFEQAFMAYWQSVFQQWRPQSKAETQRRLREKDGDWWSSQRRLPDKWVLRYRDQRLSDCLVPNGVLQENAIELCLPNDLSNWGALELHQTKSIEAFEPLPKALKRKTVWQYDDMKALTAWTKAQDALMIPME